ncbi:Uncharacterised nucleotidyltransferase [Desulfacinum infernum DSM 9756]|jgi:hypothetical protein|uniref:Uncharacterized nucleotidyltransferase n=2 Tax=Desulfacinum infernum TaxID=35837 RepID=A0A1M4SMM6_9BACT|nr:Uncharacterised nucleotidyltransferase [Desulfacinum infernum DSM 9756]
MKFRKTVEVLVSFFEEQGIDYALIGAFALHAYGYTRATGDLDFIVRRESREKVVSFLESLGYHTLECSRGFSNHVHPLEGLGRVDFVYVSGETADAIFSAVRRTPLFGRHELPVAKPEHLIALKVFAMKNDPTRLFREMADLEYLVRVDGVNQEEVKKIFRQYGMEDRYEQLVS